VKFSRPTPRCSHFAPTLERALQRSDTAQRVALHQVVRQRWRALTYERGDKPALLPPPRRPGLKIRDVELARSMLERGHALAIATERCACGAPPRPGHATRSSEAGPLNH
jgi:hypothetical protein